MLRLVVGLHGEEVSEGGLLVECAPDEEAPGLVAHPDEEGEGQGRDPPLRGNWVEADNEGVGEVDEESSATSLKDEAKVEHPVGHALLEDGEDASLADDHVRPLDLQVQGVDQMGGVDWSPERWRGSRRCCR